MTDSFVVIQHGRAIAIGGARAWDIPVREPLPSGTSFTVYAKDEKEAQAEALKRVNELYGENWCWDITYNRRGQLVAKLRRK